MDETYCEGSWNQFTTKGQNPNTRSSGEHEIQDVSIEYICNDYVKQVGWGQIHKKEN